MILSGAFQHFCHVSHIRRPNLLDLTISKYCEIICSQMISSTCHFFRFTLLVWSTGKLPGRNHKPIEFSDIFALSSSGRISLQYFCLFYLIPICFCAAEFKFGGTHLSDKFFTFYSLLDERAICSLKQMNSCKLVCYFSLHIFSKYLLETA